MSRIKVLAFSLSIDGFGAGPRQSLEAPLGVGGESLHRWVFGTQATGGATSTDDDFVRRSFHNIGAWIMGRNMFGPIRGAWPDDTWKGWWGDDPPYHVPVFVLTHHARPSVVMQGGSTFHFVTGGIHEALTRAQHAAQDKDIRIGGGVATVRQYLQAGLIDEMHLAITPTLLGNGEALLQRIDLAKAGFRCVESKSSDSAMHVVLKRD